MTQKKFLTEEHNSDKALKKVLGAEAAEKDVAAFSQEDATPVHKLDSEGRQTYLPRRSRRSRRSGKGRGKKPHNQNQNNSTLNALVAKKQATRVPSANIGTIHAIPVDDRVTSQMHASLNLRRSTR